MLKWSICPCCLQKVLNHAIESEPQGRETKMPTFPDESFLLGHSVEWWYKSCFRLWLFWTACMWLVASVQWVGRPVLLFPRWVCICLEPRNAALKMTECCWWHGCCVKRSSPQVLAALNPAAGGVLGTGLLAYICLKSGAEDLAVSDESFMLCA